MAEQQTQAAAGVTTLDGDTKKLLEQILEKQQTAAAHDSMTTVKFGANGLEATDLAGMWRLANMYSRSDIVPTQYRGKPENCLIAMEMAQRCKMNTFAFMQNSYVVHGRPGIEGKLAIAMLNASGKIKGRVSFKFAGDGKGRVCTASVVDRESDQAIEMPLPWSVVEAEGWAKKEGSKWLTIPDQMFRYRSAVFLIRAHYPEVLMGLQTVEELEELQPATVEKLPVGRVSLADLDKPNGNGHAPAEAPAPPDDGMTDAEKAAIIAAEQQEQQREPVAAGRRADRI